MFFYSPIFWLFCISCCCNTLTGQVYTEKQSRHRFAQLNLGIEHQIGWGGSINYLDGNQHIHSLQTKPQHSTRFLLGGLHFWGHADFLIAISMFNPKSTLGQQAIKNYARVETIFKYYPWQIRKNRMVPYLGISLAPYRFQQQNKLLPNENTGYNQSYFRVPVVAGFNTQLGNHLFELGVTYNYSNKIQYAISSNHDAVNQMPALYTQFSYRYLIETTLSAEKEWENGRTQRVTHYLDSLGKLNGFFLGIGLSSAWWLGKSSYNLANYPAIKNYGISILPDLSIGYYWNHLDFNLSVNYRTYTKSASAYGLEQRANRHSIGIEASKFLFDYHGFVPFMGMVISHEWLSFNEQFTSMPAEKYSVAKPGLGFSVGWDIRPNRLQSFILRTNLRYYPVLNLEVVSNKKINFSAFEFNFIQLVLYPGRM